MNVITDNSAFEKLTEVISDNSAFLKLAQFNYKQFCIIEAKWMLLLTILYFHSLMIVIIDIYAFLKLTELFKEILHFLS